MLESSGVTEHSGALEIACCQTGVLGDTEIYTPIMCIHFGADLLGKSTVHCVKLIKEPEDISHESRRWQGEGQLNLERNRGEFFFFICLRFQHKGWDSKNGADLQFKKLFIHLLITSLCYLVRKLFETTVKLGHGTGYNLNVHYGEFYLNLFVEIISKRMS